MHFRFIVKDEQGITLNETELHSGESLMVGRQPECEIVLPSPNISRQHAQFIVKGDKCVVKDMGSSNGVVINGKHVVGSLMLPSKTTLFIGEYQFHVALIEQQENDPFIHDPNSSGIDYSAFEYVEARLIGENAEVEEKVYELIGDENSIGRTGKNEVQIESSAVSRHHARIIRQNQQYIIVDLKSSNGTTVNGTSATSPIVLRDGDNICFGRLSFRFEIAGQTRVRQERESKSRSHKSLLSIMLVMVSLIVVLLIVLVLQKSKNIKEITPPEAAPWVMARNAGQEAKEAGDWETAVREFRSAYTANPNDQLLNELNEAEAEFEAQTFFQSCMVQVETAERLQAAGQVLAATEALTQAQVCLLAIPTNTQAGVMSQMKNTEEIIPELLILYRYLGAASLQSHDYQPAVQSFELAAQIYESNPEIELAASFPVQYHAALLGAGDEAFEREAWTRAIEHYNRANTLSTLDETRQERLSQAQEHLE